MLIWTNFDSFAIEYLISILLQKFHFAVEVVLNSLETRKGLELVFRLQFLYNFMMELFLLEYDINWPNFMNRVRLLPKYSVKCISCFMLRCLMRSWNLKIWNSKIWFSPERKELLKWNKKHLTGDKKHLTGGKKVWQVLSFRLKKQTSKNVAGTTFSILRKL